jgi:carboxyl-terminal processing protease
MSFYSMKRTCYIILLLCCVTGGMGQQPTANQALTKQQVHALTTLGELWGFLKYYHPAVAKGKWDWDSVLFKKIPLYLQAKDKTAISRLSHEWIIELGVVDKCQACYTQIPDSLLTRNLDLTWINEQTFTRPVKIGLEYIRDNRNTGSHYYVENDKTRKTAVNFIHEKTYATLPAYPGTPYRLLLLFRYWNIVNYYSPYKYLNGKDWKEVLKEKVPAFYEAKDATGYHLEYLKLINSLGDGHSYAFSRVVEKFTGKSYWPPFLCMQIDNQFVVSIINNDSATAANHIKKGDIILEVNGENALQKYKRLAPYTISSNETSRPMSFSARGLFTGTDSLFVIKKKRGNNITTDTLRLYETSLAETEPARNWELLPGSIGYINMAFLKSHEVDSMMRALMHTNGLIIDIRNYPRGTWINIANYLCKKPFTMCLFSYPVLDYPGVFRYLESYVYGKENKAPYTGKVVLLVDEGSVSHAEFSAMGLQAATKTITIGNTTAGKDGNVTYPIWLPGGLTTRFSGLGIYYPDGGETQRIGIRIDINVRPTIKGLQEGRDELVERAISYIQSNQ